MTADTENTVRPALPVVNPHRYIYTPSLEIARRKYSDGSLITAWPIMHEFGGTRLFVRPKYIEGEYGAFDFELLGLMKRDAGDEPSWDNPRSLVRSICSGFCGEEGLKYTYMGDPLIGASGMVENLDPKALAEAMLYVAMYQKKWCFFDE